MDKALNDVRFCAACSRPLAVVKLQPGDKAKLVDLPTVRVGVPRCWLLCCPTNGGSAKLVGLLQPGTGL